MYREEWWVNARALRKQGMSYKDIGLALGMDWRTAKKLCEAEELPRQLLSVNMEGEVLSGEGYPTTETPMHLRLYRELEDIGGVVHAHPPVATAFAVAGKPLDLHLIPEAVIFLGEVPLVPFHPPGSPELAEAIVPYLADHDAVLLENHGVLCWGSDVEQAYHRLETVEFCAQVTFTSQQLGGARELPAGPLENLLNLRRMMKGGGR
ncbi:MAG: class II aldolase/adducin family protein [Actinobacteria bacterium]|nr:class II aldolase/adducin family protein [Actinomycetota bacterium]